MAEAAPTLFISSQSHATLVMVLHDSELTLATETRFNHNSQTIRGRRQHHRSQSTSLFT